MALRAKTIHFGYANIFPLDPVTHDDILQLEKKLGSHVQVTGKNVPGPELSDIRCQHHENIFTLRIKKAGELQSALNEPLYALTVLIGPDGLPSEMHKVYTMCLDVVSEVLEIPKLVIMKEATIRVLYGAITDQPSFRYLWEHILKRPPEALSAFGGTTGGIAGGGLHFVVGPGPIPMHEEEVVIADFKIESFSRDPRYIWVEAKYNWVKPVKYETIDDNRAANTASIAHVIDNTAAAMQKFLGEAIL